jgi:hypothetical protein
MNCSEAEQFFDAFLDGELAGSLRLEFDAHRLRCPACQQKLAMVEACEHILARDSRVPTPRHDFTDRVMKAISQRRVIKLHARRRRIAIAASILLPAAMIGLFAILWPFSTNLGSAETAGVVDARTVAPELEEMIEEKDKVELYAYIFNKADQLVAASSRLAKDVYSPLEFARNWTIPDFPEALVPAEEEVEDTAEPAPNATGTFSL